jgi:hypothetical protein
MLTQEEEQVVDKEVVQMLVLKVVDQELLSLKLQGSIIV